MSGKIILNLAISLDGYIADKDGGYGWITGDGDSTLNTGTPFDFAKFVDKIDVVLMGSTCYAQGMAEPYSTKKVYVATSKKQGASINENVTFIKGDIVEIIKKERDSGKNVYLFGGGIVIDPFIKADIIDEYIIGVIPTVLGGGIKLFMGDNNAINLHLKDFSTENGVVMLSYTKR